MWKKELKAIQLEQEANGNLLYSSVLVEIV